MALHVWLIRFSGLIVPRRLRADWRQEWEAELQWRETQLAEWDKLDGPNKLALLWHSAGALADALWLQPRRWEDEMIQDLRFGARMLRKHKSFTLVAVLTLALGIGATTAIFSVVNGVLLRALPYQQPERLVLLSEAPLTAGDLGEGAAAAVWKHRLNWAARVTSFDALAVYSMGDGGVNLSGVGEPERIEAVEVSANFFQTLGVNPVLGRSFAANEEQPGRQMVAVISYELWQWRFNGALDVLGKALALNGKSFLIVGVAPRGLRYPRAVSVWIPLAPALGERVFTNPAIQYAVFGRLKAGVTPAQAGAESNAAISSLRSPAEPGRRAPNMRTVKAVPLLDHLVGNVRQVLWLLLGAVGLVLLIACANVANLLLALGATRQRELAVRAALGAGRLRLLRQALTESCLLALAGGLLGLLLAVWLTRLLVWLGPPQLPRMADITFDARVFLFTLGASLLTGLLAGLLPGLLPALRSSKADLNEALKQGSGRGGGARGGRVNGVLTLAQVALSFVLLVGAGLLTRSFINVLNIETGFQTANILTISLSLPRARYETAEAARGFMRQLVERLQAQPQFQAVGVTNKLPLNKAEVIGLLFEVEGPAPPAKFDERFALFISASPDYFRALGLTLSQGRVFNERDTPTAPPVIIINELLARRFFPNGQALGRRIKVTGEKQPREIVGVVNNVRSLGLERDNDQEMFLPYLQGGPLPNTLVLRTDAAPASAWTAVQAVVNTLDKDLPLFDGKTMRQQVYDSVAQRSYLLWLMGALAVLGLLLTMVGIYGVSAYWVTQRTHEIGIRMALGAPRRAVIRLVLREALWPVLLGLLVGVAVSLAAARGLASLLYGLPARDPLTLGLAALLMLCVALFASWWPARRATQVDPLIALRHE